MSFLKSSSSDQPNCQHSISAQPSSVDSYFWNIMGATYGNIHHVSDIQICGSSSHLFRQGCCTVLLYISPITTLGRGVLRRIRIFKLGILIIILLVHGHADHGGSILHHLGCKETCQSRDKPTSNYWRISAIKSTTKGSALGRGSSTTRNDTTLSDMSSRQVMNARYAAQFSCQGT